MLAETGGLGGVSTQRSGALVRTHYADAGSARLALGGLQHFEAFAERYGGPAGFVATGFAYVPGEAERADGSFGERVRMQWSIGVRTELLAAAARADGVDLRPYTRVERLLCGGDGALTQGGRAIGAASTVLCAGAWSAGLAAGAGVTLCCGWSGPGFETGPSVGAALAPWIARPH